MSYDNDPDLEQGILEEFAAVTPTKLVGRSTVGEDNIVIWDGVYRQHVGLLESQEHAYSKRDSYDRAWKPPSPNIPLLPRMFPPGHPCRASETSVRARMRRRHECQQEAEIQLALITDNRVEVPNANDSCSNSDDDCSDCSFAGGAASVCHSKVADSVR